MTDIGMIVLVATGELLQGVASAGFGASLGYAVKSCLEQRERARD